MRKLVLVLVALVAFTIAVEAQAAPKSGQFGMQTAVTFTSTSATFSPSGDIGVKYMVTDAIGIRGALGFANSSAGTGFDIAAGFEYHLAGKGGVSPYAGAQLSYSGSSVSGGGGAPSDFGLSAVFGAEYFFSSNFSWGGEAQLGFRSTSNGTTSQTTFGTAQALLILTWYLN